MLESYQVGLLTTFVLGIFVLIGVLIALLIKRKTKLINFSMGLAFGVILGLIFTDLLPEIFSRFGLKYIYLFIIFSVIGYFIFRILDQYVPEHHDEKRLNKAENNSNLIHIGIMLLLALVVHNIIEGMTVYSSALSDPKLGVTLVLGLGFHNISLGIVITSYFYHSVENKKMLTIPILVMALSTFIGGLIMYMFNIQVIGDVVLGVLLSLSLGMLLFIVLSELLVRIKNTNDKEAVFIGMLIGIISLFINLLIG